MREASKSLKTREKAAIARETAQAVAAAVEGANLQLQAVKAVMQDFVASTGQMNYTHSAARRPSVAVSAAIVATRRRSSNIIGGGGALPAAMLPCVRGAQRSDVLFISPHCVSRARACVGGAVRACSNPKVAPPPTASRRSSASMVSALKFATAAAAPATIVPVALVHSYSVPDKAVSGPQPVVRVAAPDPDGAVVAGPTGAAAASGTRSVAGPGAARACGKTISDENSTAAAVTTTPRDEGTAAMRDEAAEREMGASERPRDESGGSSATPTMRARESGEQSVARSPDVTPPPPPTGPLDAWMRQTIASTLQPMLFNVRMLTHIIGCPRVPRSRGGATPAGGAPAAQSPSVQEKKRTTGG